MILVRMTREGVEDPRLVAVEGMFASLRPESDAPGDAELPALRVRRAIAARCDHGDLGGPTAPEAGHTLPEDGAGELHLAAHPRIVAVVDGQARAGPHDPVVVPDLHPPLEHGLWVGRMRDVDPRLRRLGPQESRVELARRRAPRLPQGCASFARVSVEHQEAHVVQTGRSPEIVTRSITRSNSR